MCVRDPRECAGEICENLVSRAVKRFQRSELFVGVKKKELFLGDDRLYSIVRPGTAPRLLIGPSQTRGWYTRSGWHSAVPLNTG